MESTINNVSPLKNSKTPRNSSIELIRIILLFGIVLCHLLEGGKDLSGINKYLTILANSGMNAGLGIDFFMLITGYFGINFTLNKLNNTYSIIYTCSIAMLIIRAAFDTVTIKSCLLALIPVSHKFLWYASCYIYLLILSPFLNLAINKMSKKCFQKLILVMIILLNVVPTFLYYDIMGDKGKGLVTMIELYFIGRYLKLYPIKIKRSTAIISFFVIMIIGFIGNIAATLVRSGETSFPFSRECTIISLSLAILLLLIAVDIPFYSKAINLISSKVFYAFLLSPQVILGFFLSVDNLKSSLLYLPACIGFVALSLVIVFALSFVLQYPAKLMTIILDKAEKLSVKLLKKFKFFNRIENYFINGDNVNG